MSYANCIVQATTQLPVSFSVVRLYSAGVLFAVTPTYLILNYHINAIYGRGSKWLLSNFLIGSGHIFRLVTFVLFAVIVCFSTFFV